ncbi:TonB-dependent receptor [Microbulbifer harenosus]|uniref:TonB-dependent receptor n=1 Tax=Microbulbifer harenosus TaxID=2576840 RepID=A0ABY2ULN3_9GAMM|nr:TonB-dependent receptor [Microbulbifer harenosus]TLM76704.1 TonB-dependent receptor [Microbulbifer harenosus]
MHARPFPGANRPNVLAAAVATAIAVQLSPTALAAELEEITVTAQKRTERITEVPIAITNVGAEAIKQTGVRQVREVAQFVPNLNISSGTDFTTTVTMRGVGSDSRNIGFDTRVGVYLDGVYLGQSPAINQDLVDLERIEVLRGPQGTLFGKNTVAGAINLISQKPSDEFSGSVGVEYGSMNSRQLSATLNAPLSKSLFSKISVNRQQRDGYIRNLTTGNLLNEQDGSAYRAQLMYDAGGAFNAILAVDGMESDRLSTTGEAVTNPFGTGPDTAAPEMHQVAMNVDPREEREIRGAALTMEWSLPSDFTLRSITSSRDTEMTYNNDTDYSPYPLVEITYTDSYAQQTQEFQLVSPGADDFNYVAGLYLYQQEGDSYREVTSSKFFEDLLQAQYGAPGLVNPDSPVVSAGIVDTSSIAAYINGSYQLTDAWKLGFGLRYSEEQKEVDWAIDGSGAPLFGTATGTVRDDRTDSHLSPTVSINYALSEEANVYGKYSGGFKSGGYNLDFVAAGDLVAGTDFDKETVDAFEIGLKGTAFSRQFSYSLALFQSNYEDYQVNQFVDLGQGATSISIRNAAEVETRGLEAEITWLASDNLTINASMGLLDAEFASYPNADANGSDLSGNQLPNAPETSFNLGGQYYLPINSIGADLLLRLDYIFRDSFYNTAENESKRTLANGDTVQFGQVDAYHLVNARIGLESHADSWNAALFVHNLTDEEYMVNTSRDFLGTLRHFYGLERTAGIELEYRF